MPINLPSRGWATAEMVFWTYRRPPSPIGYDLASEQTVVSSMPSQPSNDPQGELTRQQRNLLLAGPIARLSLERRVIFKDSPEIANDIDLQYLALSAIDFVMERSAIESGAPPGGIVDHVAGEAIRVKPTLTANQSRKVGQVVLDYLANARDRHKAFRSDYYDAGRGAFTFHDFRLLSLFVAADGSARFKLGTGAQTLTLAMLDIAPEFAQEAEAIMIRKAVERGRFKDAHTIAQRSRMRSIHYQQYIDDKLFRARRAADSVIWSEEVLPELDEARRHLRERQNHETAIIESIRENIAHARDETRDQLIDLKETIENCHARHAALFSRVITASEEFRKLQARAFRARYKQDVPDLEDRILVPLLLAPMATVSNMSDEVSIAFAAPTAPKLYDLALLFENCTRPMFRQDSPSGDETHDLVALQPVPPEFDANEIRVAQDWLVNEIAARTWLDLRSAIQAAEDHGLAESTLRCALFLMLRSWCPEDDPLGVIASVDGALAHQRAVGDNLKLEKDAARWPT